MIDAILIIFIAVIGIQLFFAAVFLPFIFVKSSALSCSNLPVSVIIAAKDEAGNLEKFLPFVLEQNYAKFEVIVVNDASTDYTETVLKNLQKQHKHLKVLHLHRTKSYTGNKKNAITKGIAAAKHPYLLFTDADCRPTSKHWIAGMAANFTPSKHIVLGYGQYKKIPNSFLNKLIRFETLLTAIQYFSYAKTGIPYMGVGRNLAYKKTTFMQYEGFKSHASIRSGDDDLLINAIANKKNTALCINPDAFTISKPKKTYKKWFRQKRRHITTAAYYRPVHKYLLGLFYVSQLLFYVLTIILLTTAFNLFWVLILMLIRFTVFGFIYLKNAKKFKESDLIVLIFILEPILIFNQLIFFIENLIKKPNFW
ncbi:MAG: glycosyl transferase family 2 [Flavobacteriales bacterium]|nr:MAG: glycosyl transferase family 2 [Flavobacteriales bacterium]